MHPQTLFKASFYLKKLDSNFCRYFEMLWKRQRGIDNVFYTAADFDLLFA